MMPDPIPVARAVVLLIVAILAATVAPAARAAADVTVAHPGEQVLEPGKPLALDLAAENKGAAPAAVSARFTLQANPTYADPPVPDPVLGIDHAAGAASTVTVDGAAKGDALLCDGDDHSAFEIPWSNGVKEVVATIDLGKPIDVTAVRWTAGDANWIFKCDVLVSTDGAAYSPVEGGQGVDLHAKWGGPHAFPWARPVAARYLRLRFHNDGKPSNAVRLPPTVKIYDGIGNDAVAVPQVGPVVASGEAQASVPPRGAACT